MLVIDECEALFTEIFSGLCHGANCELGMQVLEWLVETSEKVLMLDGFLKNSSLTIACNYAASLEDVRLVIATYTIMRGTL